MKTLSEFLKEDVSAPAEKLFKALFKEFGITPVPIEDTMLSGKSISFDKTPSWKKDAIIDFLEDNGYMISYAIEVNKAYSFKNEKKGLTLVVWMVPHAKGQISVSMSHALGSKKTPAKPIAAHTIGSVEKILTNDLALSGVKKLKRSPENSNPYSDTAYDEIVIPWSAANEKKLTPAAIKDAFIKNGYTQGEKSPKYLEFKKTDKDIVGISLKPRTSMAGKVCDVRIYSKKKSKRSSLPYYD